MNGLEKPILGKTLHVVNLKTMDGEAIDPCELEPFDWLEAVL